MHARVIHNKSPDFTGDLFVYIINVQTNRHINDIYDNYNNSISRVNGI